MAEVGVPFGKPLRLGSRGLSNSSMDSLVRRTALPTLTARRLPSAMRRRMVDVLTRSILATSWTVKSSILMLSVPG